MTDNKDLTIEQVNWLIKVRDNFLPLYKHVPDMELPLLYPKMWTRGDLRGYIKDIVNSNKYSTSQDSGWLTDLRLFYIQENK